MPRRHSTLDDLITLPWWFNLILAATVYVFLKYWLPTIEKHLVQCKNWKTKSVGVPIVRELFGVVAAENATGGIIVCSGSFTQDAIEFARGKPIELVGDAELVRLIGEVQTQPKVETASTAPKLSNEPSCPTCSSPMAMRTAKRGKSAGSQFWGCSRYPKCRGTRQLDV